MSAKYKSPSFLLPNELNTSANTANDTGVNSLYSMDFNAPSSAYVDLGIITEINGLSNFTFSVWIKPVSPLGGSQGIVFGNRDTSVGGKGIAFALHGQYLTGTNYVYFENNLLTLPAGTFTFDQWSHVVITYDNATLAAYVDNSLINSVSLANKSLTSTATFNLGRDVGAPVGKYFNGQIDEFAIFNKALNATERAALYDGTGSNIRPSNLMAANLNPVAYYPLGEQAQNTGKLPEATANVWQFPNGVLQDYVMDFDGTSKYIDIPSSSSLVFGSGDFTISFWIKTADSTANILNPISSQGAGFFGLMIYQGKLRWNDQYNVSNLWVINNTQIVTNTWINVVIIKNSGTFYVWYNNVPQTLTATSDSQNYNGNNGLRIGSGNLGDLDGQLSNMAIWNSNQTANVANIYNNGSPQTSYTVTPQNWWKLNADSVYTPSAPNYTTSLNFSGSGNNVSFNSITLSSAGGYGNKTVSYWLKPSGAGLIVAGSAYTYYSYYNGSSIVMRDSSGTSGWPPLSLDNTKWHHFCITGDGTNATLYVNGESKGSQLDRSPTVDTIGSYTGGSDGFFNGNVSNLAIYNVILTSSQVSTLFNFGTPETNISFSPQAWWKLDDQNAITDSSGNGNTGTNNGASNSPGGVAYVPSWKISSALPITTTPNYTTALDFVGGTSAGSGHSIDISSYTGLSNTSAFTVSIWFKGEDFSTDWIFSTSIAGDFGSNVIGLDLNNSGQLRPNIVFNGTSANISNVDIDLNKWYHAAITYDGSTGIATMYVNTVAYAGTNNLGSTTPTFSNNLVIAALEFRVASPSFGYYFDGLLSNMSIFNTALPATGSNSIETLYNNGTPLISMSSFSSLQAWWKLDNLTTGIQDSSGNGYNGTNSGATQLSSDVLTPQPVNGVSTTLPSTALQQSDLQFDSPYSNYSLSFDGTVGVTTGGITAITPSNSICFWFNNSTAAGGLAPLIASLNYISGALQNFAIRLETTNKLTVVLLKNGNYVFLSSNTVLANNTWHFVTLTTSTSGSNVTNTLYINGTQDVTNTGLNNSNLADLVNGLTMGYWLAPGSATYNFNGKIDETSIFNYSLSAAQVLEIYNNGKPSNLFNYSGTAPISWWRLGENAYFDNNNVTLPNSITGAPNGVSSGTATSMLSADAPGTYANGVGTNLDIVDRVGDAPLSTANSQSYNMIPDDKVPYVPGYVGAQISNTSEMTFDGVDDIFDLSSEVLFDSTKSFSVSAWVKLTGYSPSLYPSIAKFKTDTSTGWTFGLSNASAYAGVFFGSSTNFARGRTDGDISADFIGVWKHICLVFDGVDKAALSSYKIYVDGSNIGLTGAGAFSTVSNTSSVIGGQPGNKFNGQIDEVAIFDTALSADQVKFDLYNATTTGKTADIENNTNLPTPVAWYRMGD